MCIGEETKTGKQARSRKERLRFPVPHKRTLAASKLPLLFKAKQVFFLLIETRQHLVQYAFIRFGVKNPFL